MQPSAKVRPVLMCGRFGQPFNLVRKIRHIRTKGSVLHERGLRNVPSLSDNILRHRERKLLPVPHLILLLLKRVVQGDGIRTRLLRKPRIDGVVIPEAHFVSSNIAPLDAVPLVCKVVLEGNDIYAVFGVILVMQQQLRRDVGNLALSVNAAQNQGVIV